MKRIAIASDHAGFRMKETIKKYLVGKGYAVADMGTDSEERCDYPAFAYALAKAVAFGKFKQGILICKTGIGNSIVANRVPGVRASLCCNYQAAKLTREHNDSNVLVLGSAFVSAAQAKRIASVWLNTAFTGGRHKKRLNQIREIEKDIKKWRR